MTVVRRNATIDFTALMVAREAAKKDVAAEGLLTDATKALIDVFAPLLIAADPLNFPTEAAVRARVKQRIRARL